MSRSVSLSGWVAVVLVGCIVVAQEPAKPGPEHEIFKELEGTWDAVIKSEGGQSTGVMTYKLECGGLWLCSDFKGDFGGTPFQGKGIDGYDTTKKKYVGVWVDSMSSAPMMMEGTYDAATKTGTMIGKGPGPDGKPATFKSVSVRKDRDHDTFTMSLVDPSGKDIPMLTIEYTRRK